ncbi:hypothetical protein D9613_007011 [Agrocybe pediades]|uniref:Uncharacterized protein n=1 Tax=Agrocybe pediades TaxID=84607 RepID=A0A8H4QGH2_9AGAR|nr:hypothetical protein D9613_007011 [Agrocybe pediades]KAF9563077.1 hypothetical protein CPC08DRAFT_340411 [Agrocybe pediades]
MSSSIVRDSRFSMSMYRDSEAPSTSFRRTSYAKQLERRIVGVWKLVTRNTRKQPRNSYIHPDFVVITSRRKSILYPQTYHMRK